MKRKGIAFFALFALLPVLLALTISSCGGASVSDSKNTPQTPDNTPEKNEADTGLKVFSENSALPALPGDPYSLLDANMLVQSGTSPYTLSDPEGKIEYVLEGSADITDCVISEIRVRSPEYAICGMSVGDSPDACDMFFIGLGFRDASEKSRTVYRYGVLTVEIVTGNNKITSFIIKKTGGVYA